MILEDFYTCIEYLHFHYGGTLEDWWIIPGQGKLSLVANMNDLFWWAVADNEDFTTDDIPLHQKACEDLKTLIDSRYLDYADMLWASRKRGMRLQLRIIKGMPESIQPLFLAAGPEKHDG